MNEHLTEVTNRARRVMERDNIDALVVTVCDNFYYITGLASFFMYTFRHTGAAVAVVFRDPKTPSLVIMNEFEAAGLKLDMPNYEIKTFPVWVDVDEPFNPNREVKPRPIAPPTETVFTILKNALSDANVLDKTIAIELNAMSHGGKCTLDKIIPNIKLVDSTPIFNEIRQIKTPWEIAHLRRAATITEHGIQEAIKQIKVGSTSADITAAFKAAVMQQSGCNYSRFHIVTIGENFSPRFIADNTIKAKSGDLIKFDCGVDVAGYGADTARTVVLGQPNDMTKRIYDTLRLGHEHLLSLVAPGVKLKYAFDEAMNKIKTSGLPTYNRGHMGHGDGVFLALEEEPFVCTTATEVFTPGMVLSLETPYNGIGIGAIMIEDMVLITDTGYELLTHSSRDLISV